MRKTINNEQQSLYRLSGFLGYKQKYYFLFTVCMHLVLAGQFPGAVYSDRALSRSHHELPKASLASDQLAVLVGPGALPPLHFPGFPAQHRLNPHHPGLVGLLLWRSVSSIQTPCQSDHLPCPSNKRQSFFKHFVSLLISACKCDFKPQMFFSDFCPVLKHASWQLLDVQSW